MTIEAPPMEPRELHGTDGVLLELVSRTFAAKRGPVQRARGHVPARASRARSSPWSGPAGAARRRCSS